VATRGTNRGAFVQRLDAGTTQPADASGTVPR
jgi:hypothetical protein